MAISLGDLVTEGYEDLPPKIFLYGEPGWGKSSFAADAPEPIFLRLEDRHAHLNIKKLPLITEYEQFKEYLTMLINEPHPYQTVVIDTLDWLEKGPVHKQVLSEYFGEDMPEDSKTINDIKWGKGFARAAYYAREIVTGLDVLRTKRKMGIILLAHCIVKDVNPPESDPYQTYTYAMHEKFSSVFEQWADNIFFGHMRSVVKKKEGKFGKEVSRAIGQGERVIYTEKRPAWEAKNSCDLPYEILVPKVNPFSSFQIPYMSWRTENIGGTVLPPPKKEKKKAAN